MRECNLVIPLVLLSAALTGAIGGWVVASWVGHWLDRPENCVEIGEECRNE